MFHEHFTHMLQEHVPIFHLFLVLCCIHFAGVLCCSAGGESRAGGLGTWRAGGPTDGVLQVGARWGVLVLSRSSRLLCVARTESQREEGSGEGPAGAEARLVRTRWWGKGGRGRVARASGRSDVRALATPKKEVSQKKKAPPALFCMCTCRTD
jgi:hypothetical protein